MKNLVLGAAITAAMFGGVANAALTLDTNGIPVIDTDTTEVVYLSGASAARGFIEELITNAGVPSADAICDTSKPVWKFQDAGNGKSQNAYMCELDAGNSALAGIVTSKPNVLIYKRSAGGSAQGVSPLINQDVADAQSDLIEFLDITSGCTLTTPAAVGTLGKVVCPSTHLAVPDFGVSDVDPIQFRAQNTPAGFAPVSEVDLGKLTVTGSVALTFGIPVTTDMRNGLQEAQFGVADPCVGDDSEACMPSLSRNQIASIYTGKLSNWDQLKVGGVSVFSNASSTYKGVGPVANRVHICRRVDGSGTQAQHGINFLNTPCAGSAAATPATDNTGLNEFAPVAQVHENSGSGDVSDCLAVLDTGSNTTTAGGFTNTYGKRWAVGIQSLEKASANFRFIKVDGIAPTLANVASGQYLDFAELTFQYNTARMTDASRANTKAIADALIASAGEPTVVGEINKKFNHGFHASQEVGYLANPNAFTANADGSVDITKPVNPYTHANGAAPVNNCRIPMIKAGAATQI